MSTISFSYRKTIIRCSRCDKKEEMFVEKGYSPVFKGWFSPGGDFDYCPKHSAMAKKFFGKNDENPEYTDG